MVRKFAEYKARVAKRKANKGKADKPKPTGDGPSGFDYYQATKRHC